MVVLPQGTGVLAGVFEIGGVHNGVLALGITRCMVAFALWAGELHDGFVAWGGVR